MPRPARRLLLPGYPLHVLQRGHNKDRVFISDADHGLYLGLLQEYSQRHSCAVHAYVLMSNHIHLLVSPAEVPCISRMMRDVNQIFGQHLNRRLNKCGCVWQGRFKAILVHTGEYFLACQRYIELNPVRAGMVEKPHLYPWSSYGANAEGKPSLLIAPHRRYLELGAAPASRQAAYRGLFEQPLSAEVLSRIRTAIQRNRPLGDDDFILEVEAEPVPHLSQVPVPYLALV
jgi:putative transposase